MSDEMKSESVELAVTACEKFAANNEVSLWEYLPTLLFIYCVKDAAYKFICNNHWYNIFNLSFLIKKYVLYCIRADSAVK